MAGALLAQAHGARAMDGVVAREGRAARSWGFWRVSGLTEFCEPALDGFEAGRRPGASAGVGEHARRAGGVRLGIRLGESVKGSILSRSTSVAVMEPPKKKEGAAHAQKPRPPTRAREAKGDSGCHPGPGNLETRKLRSAREGKFRFSDRDTPAVQSQP
jgi:hypothetical protein